MKIEYDEFNNLWIITKKVGEKEIEIRITEWFATEKGRLIDIAVFISEDGESKESKENEFFYDFEILNCKLMASQISEVSKEIFDSYDSIHECFAMTNVVDHISSVFPKKKIDAYFRKLGHERECRLYVKRRYKLSTRSFDTTIYKGTKYPRPVLEYPGSRLDSICD